MDEKGATGEQSRAAIEESSDESVPVKQIGIVRVQSPDEVTKQQKIDSQMQKVDSEPVDRLGYHLNNLWQRAKEHRETSGMDDELLESLLVREGEYSPSQKTKLEDQNELDDFEPIVADIIRSARAWIEDMLNLPHGNIFSVDPTPLPDLPDDITKMIVEKTLKKAAMVVAETGRQITPDQVYEFSQRLRVEVEKFLVEEASDRAEKMNDLIQDQFLDGDFFSAILQAVDDLCTFPTAFLKGPVVYEEEDLMWEFSVRGPVAKKGKVFRPRWYAPSPLDMFPSPNCSKINEGYIFERMRMDPAALAAFGKVPGFNKEAIDRVVELHAAQGHVELTAEDQLRARLEKRHSLMFNFSGVIEVKGFQGMLKGSDIKDFGFSCKIDADDFYPVIAWLHNNRCLMCRMNANPNGEWQYSADSFERRSGSIWGRGLPQVLRNDQKIANGYRRSASNNASQAGGFQTTVDLGQLAEGQDVTNPYPGKVWQMQGKSPGTTGAGNKPIDFYQPRAIFHLLEKLIDSTKKRAEERAGIPPYLSGSDRARGAAETLGGLSILMNNAAKGLRSILRHMDEGLVRPSVKRQWLFNMLFHPDQSVKGDVQVTARGALGQVIKESIFLRRQDFLNMTANPVDMKIIGIEGRRKLLEEQEQNLDLTENSVVPTEEELRARLEAENKNAANRADQPQDVVEVAPEKPQEGVDRV